MRAAHFLLMTLLALLAALAPMESVSAQELALTGPGTPTHIHAELVAESASPRAGGTVALAISMRPEAGWHGYWINPGDAGLPLDPKWTLPAGASVSVLRYPAPTRLLIAGLMNHVFEGPYALLTTLSLPPGLHAGDPLPVVLDARWLACTDTICVPERARLTLDLRVGEGKVTAADRARFDGWRAALPRPLGSMASYARDGTRLSIAIPYPAAAPVAAPWFYAADKGVLAAAAPQSARRVGDRLVIETTLASGASPGGSLRGVVTVAPDSALELEARPGSVPVGGEPVGDGAGSSAGIGWAGFALALGGAILGGLLLNVMPCVFPILSLKAVALARAGGDGREARVEALAYGAGILLCCLALGGAMLALRAAGHSVGWAFQLQDGRVIALLLVVAVAITLNLGGVFALPALDGGRQGEGATGAFLTGLLAAFVATPCTGPFMAAAMGTALILPWPMALAIFAGLAVGLALPFLLLAYVPPLRRRLPRPGAWMERLRHVMAVPMALTVLALGWLMARQGGDWGIALAVGLAAITLLLCLLLGRRQRAGRGGRPVVLMAGVILLACVALLPPLLPAQGAAALRRDVVAFDDTRLAALRNAGRPIFLYFTADWCVTCKVNEANAISSEDVLAAFRRKGVTVMEGDWTRGDPAITRFLEAHGRSGVPLYLFYPRGGGGSRELPQLLTPAMLVAAAE